MIPARLEYRPSCTRIARTAPLATIGGQQGATSSAARCQDCNDHVPSTSPAHNESPSQTIHQMLHAAYLSQIEYLAEFPHPSNQMMPDTLASDYAKYIQSKHARAASPLRTFTGKKALYTCTLLPLDSPTIICSRATAALCTRCTISLSDTFAEITCNLVMASKNRFRCRRYCILISCSSTSSAGASKG